jgi:sRNA-binding regulator protein Hfq
LAKIDKPLMKSTAQPVNITMFAGFFIAVGLILLVLDFYFTGKLKVPEGMAHDQMGHVITVKKVDRCQYEFVIPNHTKNSSQQRQSYALNQLFPTVKLDSTLTVVFCNGEALNVEIDTVNQYQVLLKKNNRSYLFLQKEGEKPDRLG